MKPLLILKLGATLPALAAQSDFEDWELHGSGLTRAETIIVDHEFDITITQAYIRVHTEKSHKGSQLSTFNFQLETLYHPTLDF